MTAPSILAALAATPRQKPKRNQHEFEHQAALFEWARNPAVVKSLPGIELLEGSMNGVKLDAVQAKKAKAAGMLTGSHDVRLPVARGQWIGFSAELKYGDNRPSPDQLKVGEALEREGWLVGYFWDWVVLREAIIEYLNQPKPRILEAS